MKTMKAIQPCVLSMAVAAFMHSTIAQASDLEVFQIAKPGQVSLVLMLDTSGSMGSGSIAEDFNSNNSCTVYSDTATDTSSGLSYPRNYCDIGGVRKYDRLSRLKDAMFAIMNDGSDSVTTAVMGLGHFSGNGDSKTGKILVKAAPLGAVGSAQRLAIKTAVDGLSTAGSTPSAHAYAEAAAYMLGTTTYQKNVATYDIYQYYSGTTPYYQTCKVYNAIDYKKLTRTCKTLNNATTTSPVTPGMVWVKNASNSNGWWYTPNNAGDPISGTPNSNSATKLATNGPYDSPLAAVADRKPSCDGQGIYFLSDGEPNNSSAAEAQRVMAMALNDTGFTCDDNSVTAAGVSTTIKSTGTGDAWSCMAKFSKRLYSSTDNPQSVRLKTAFVGFGKVFAGAGKATFNKYVNDQSVESPREFYKCSDLKGDAKNACNIAEKPPQPATGTPIAGFAGVGGFGNGGFYYAETSESVVDSIRKFLDELKTEIPPVPTGSVTIPLDTLDPTMRQPYGYMPLLKATPDKSNLVWTGNVKKYQAKNATYYGADGELVFADRAGALSKTTRDYWNATTTDDQALVSVGGAASRIPVPTTASTTTKRNVMFNVSDSAAALTPMPDTITNITALTTLSLAQKLQMLNFMGYELDPALSILPTILPAAPAAPYVQHGGVSHSSPVVVTVQGKIKADGTPDTARTDLVVYGSMDGALHVVDGDTGVEKLAYIPSDMLVNAPQSTAFKPLVTGAPRPVAGVDGPWTAYTEYKSTTNSDDTVTKSAKKVQVYGGLRMGGYAYYGLDLTNLSAPKLLFRIGPKVIGTTLLSPLLGLQETGSNTTYSRMGQSWSKPVITNIRYNGNVVRVMIVGGGYDPQYEDPAFNATGASTTLGNSVYIVNAETGALIKAISTADNADIKYSIPGSINVQDRDADGLTDHLYFSDLGGQVFRVDLNNRSQFTSGKTGNFVARVKTLAKITNTDSTKPRFYERPVVTIHEDGVDRFAVVSIGSGDRSNPLDILATDLGGKGVTATNNNRIYGFIDRDVTQASLMDSTYTTKATIALGDLVAGPTTTTYTAMKGASAAKRGWYHDLTGTVTGAKKNYEEGYALRGDLYMPVYDPKLDLNNASDCSAKVVGATDLYRFCLPYGVCPDITGSTPYGIFRLGAGIQGITIAPTGTDGRTIAIGFNQPNVTNSINQPNQNTYNYTSTPTVIPTAWFEKRPDPSKFK